MMSFIHWQGQDAFKGGQHTLTDPGVVAAETYRKVVGANAPLGSNGRWHQTFLDGNAGFMLDGQAGYALLNTAPDAVRPSLKMMAVPFRPAHGRGGEQLHIPAGISADRKELVWRTITQTSGEWQRRYFVLTSSPPGLPSADG